MGLPNVNFYARSKKGETKNISPPNLDVNKYLDKRQISTPKFLPSQLACFQVIHSISLITTAVRGSQNLIAFSSWGTNDDVE